MDCHSILIMKVILFLKSSTDTHIYITLLFLKEVEIRNKDLEGQLSDLEQRLEKSQNEQEAFRNNLKTLLEILDGKIFELTELRDNLAKLLERS